MQRVFFITAWDTSETVLRGPYSTAVSAKVTIRDTDEFYDYPNVGVIGPVPFENVRLGDAWIEADPGQRTDGRSGLKDWLVFSCNAEEYPFMLENKELSERAPETFNWIWLGTVTAESAKEACSDFGAAEGQMLTALPKP